jgi:hypothetical protein
MVKAEVKAKVRVDQLALPHRGCHCWRWQCRERGRRRGPDTGETGSRSSGAGSNKAGEAVDDI